MGTDIHAFVEYQDKEDLSWYSFSIDELILRRDYTMFYILSEVRGYAPNSFSVKGKIPFEELSASLQDIRTMLISKIDDEYGEIGDCTLETAKKWQTEDNCRIHSLNSEIENWRVDDPDCHTDTWLSFAEYEQALHYYENYIHKAPFIEYLAVYAVMKTYQDAGFETRLVMWFDN